MLKVLAIGHQVLGKTDVLCEEVTDISTEFFDGLSVILKGTA